MNVEDLLKTHRLNLTAPTKRFLYWDKDFDKWVVGQDTEGKVVARFLGQDFADALKHLCRGKREEKC